LELILGGCTEHVPMSLWEMTRAKGRLSPPVGAELWSCLSPKCCNGTYPTSRNFSVPLHTPCASCAGYW